MNDENTVPDTEEIEMTSDDVLRMIAVEVIHNDSLDLEVLTEILEATNHQHVLAAAKTFIDNGGLEDEEDEADEVDDADEEGEDGEEDDDSEDE